MWLGKATVFVSLLLVVSSQDFTQCGRTLPDHDITSTGKLHAAKHGEFPYMCSLFTKNGGFNTFIGGASLIATNQLLTLATAVHKARNFTLEEARKAEEDSPDNCEESHDVKLEIFVSCGDTELQSNDNPDKQVQKISKILIHPDYNPRSLINDLAVLIVEKPFSLTAAVGHVCLPSPLEKVMIDAECVATGHGRESYQYGLYSRDLRKINLPIWDNEKCEKTLNEELFSNKSMNWEIDPSFLCAGGKANEDTCEGDGGGPLLCSSNLLTTKTNKEVDYVDPIFGADDDDIFTNDEVDLRDGNNRLEKIVQVGVVAWGYRCGKENIPSVYSSVANGRCWIDQIMSCYSYKAEDFSIDLRISEDDKQPSSAGELSEEECGAWLKTEASNRAACGCKQSLDNNINSLGGTDNNIQNVDSDIDLRQVQ